MYFFPLLIYIFFTYQKRKKKKLGLSALKGLLNCTMSLVFIFLCATNQANALTIDETFDFYKIWVVEKELDLMY